MIHSSNVALAASVSLALGRGPNRFRSENGLSLRFHSASSGRFWCTTSNSGNSYLRPTHKNKGCNSGIPTATIDGHYNQRRTQEHFSGGGGLRQAFFRRGLRQAFCGGGGSNSVEDRGQTERGSGGGSPLVRGSTQFANE
jgi:hypothetical protein